MKNSKINLFYLMIAKKGKLDFEPCLMKKDLSAKWRKKRKKKLEKYVYTYNMQVWTRTSKLTIYKLYSTLLMHDV